MSQPTYEELLAQVAELQLALSDRAFAPHVTPPLARGPHSSSEHTVIHETPEQVTLVTAHAPPNETQFALAKGRQVLAKRNARTATPDEIAEAIKGLKVVITSGVESAAYGDKRTEFRSLSELRQILADLEEELEEASGRGGRIRQIRMTNQWDKGLQAMARKAPKKPAKAKSEDKSVSLTTDKVFKNDFDGGRSRRRLKSWVPTQSTVNTILSSSGNLLRSRCRDAMRNNPHACAAGDSFVSNLIGTGIKPSSLLTEKPDLRQTVMQLWLDWTDQCDADGIADFYGMQTIVGRALFEAGECFIRFRPRRVEDGYLVPLQLQLLESEMCPFEKNGLAENGNYIMNGIELDHLGKRAAYYFWPIHPGDMAIEAIPVSMQPVRVPASEVLHIFKCTRPGQMRGVPLITPALVRMFFLDQYDDAELERKRIAAMFAGFITTATPEDVIPIDGVDGSAPQENIGLSGLEPGTMQTLLPGEDIKFSEPADVGGTYEAYQYRQQLAIFSSLGIPYSLGTSDLRRANYSSLRGSIVEYRRKLEQFQHNVIVFQMCAPIWRRWMDSAVLGEALPIASNDYLLQQVAYQRAKWIPQRNDWVDPLKDRQAEKLAVDAGFKSRSDVVEAEGFDPEESDARIKADHEREDRLGPSFPVVSSTKIALKPEDPNATTDDGGDSQEEKDQIEQDAADAEDADAADAA